MRIRSAKLGGFTIVETLVAAIILAVAILGVVTVTRKSHEMDRGFVHRQRARTIIDSCFEDYEYSYYNYAALQNVAGDTVIIETRSAPHSNLKGILAISVGTAQVAETGGAGLPYNSIVAKVTWNEPEGPDSVVITKCIPDSLL